MSTLTRGISLAAVLLGFVVSCRCKAQSTWNGLTFGMPESDVEQTLKGRGFSLHAKGPNSYIADPDYMIHVPEMSKPLPFTAELEFNDKGLKEVDLQFDLQIMLQVTDSVPAIASVVTEYMRNAVLAKYGQPVQSSDACPTSSTLFVSRDHLKCSCAWRGDGQLIAVEWWFDRKPSSFIYLLSYKKASSDL